MTLLNRLKELDEAHHMAIYGREPVALVKGSGSRVTDGEGREYIDMLAGIAVTSLGHCHPALVKAIQQQAEQLIHCSNLYYTEPQAALARMLTELSGLDKVFFCNSGTEAVEGAIKLARKWGANHGKGGTIVTFRGSFHGRTLAALAATGQDKYKSGYEPLPEGFRYADFNDLDNVEDALDDDVCAVMVEPVQGEGGVRIADESFMTGLRKLCDRKKVLLIHDEIQCGMGRTGTLFAFRGYGTTPDIVTLAKALGGGMPIGAVLAKDAVAGQFGPGDHGTTFGGNPLACAAALAVLGVLEGESLSERAREMGDYLIEQLGKRIGDHDAVKEIRGRGLMVGVELTGKGKEVVAHMRENGILGNCTTGDVIRFVPALTVPKEDLETAVFRLAEALEAVHG